MQVLDWGVSAPATAEEFLERRPCATTSEEDFTPELDEFCKEEQRQNKIDKVCISLRERVLYSVLLRTILYMFLWGGSGHDRLWTYDLWLMASFSFQRCRAFKSTSCYCCGGYKEYFIQGNTCRRFCRIDEDARDAVDKGPDCHLWEILLQDNIWWKFSHDSEPDSHVTV